MTREGTMHPNHSHVWEGYKYNLLAATAVSKPLPLGAKAGTKQWTICTRTHAEAERKEGIVHLHEGSTCKIMGMKSEWQIHLI